MGHDLGLGAGLALSACFTLAISPLEFSVGLVVQQVVWGFVIVVCVFVCLA